MAARLGAATTIVAKVEMSYKIIQTLDFVKVTICNCVNLLLVTFVDLYCRSVEMSMVWPTRPTSLSRT